MTPATAGSGDVVLVMGMPGAGKSTVAAELEARGYQRLNRDLRGGSLRALVAELDRGLAAGRRLWVLDNTYPSRASRNDVIQCARSHAAPVRCIWVDTPLADAQVRAIDRLLDVHGRLPMPEELRERGRSDPRYFGPDAQFRWQRTAEPPATEEGFGTVEKRAPSRPRTPAGDGRALVLELDGVLATRAGGSGPALRAEDVEVAPARKDVIHRYADEGWLLFAHAWRPQLASGEVSPEDVARAIERARARLAVDIEIGVCPHPAGPPICWCRKPIPGLALEFAARRGVALDRSIGVGRGPADRTLAERLGMRYREESDFFGER